MRVEDLLDRVVGEVLAEVVALLRRPRLRDRRVVLCQVGIPLVGLAAEEAVEALEAAAERPAVERARRGVVLRRRQVPLAEAERVVAVLEQHLGQHPVLERHAPVVAGEARRQLHDARDAVRVVVATGQDARSRRGAQRRGVHVGVAQALGSDAIDVGCLDEPAEARQLAVSDVIEHAEEHVRGSVPSPRRRGPGGTRFLDRPADLAGERAAGGILLDAAHLFSSDYFPVSRASRPAVRGDKGARLRDRREVGMRCCPLAATYLWARATQRKPM